MNVVPGMGAGSPRRSDGVSWFKITDPIGSEIVIPSSADDDHPYFTLEQSAEFRDYYRQNGYVVIRGLVPPDDCRAAMLSFHEEVKPPDGFPYRQATANPERHQCTPHGFILNPTLNV